MKSSSKNKWFWLILVVVPALVWVAWKKSGQHEIENLGKVTRGDLLQRVTIAGTVFPNRKTVISAPYNGYVRQIFVKVGDKVRTGDPIVSLAQSLRGSAEEVYPLRAPFDGTVVQVLRSEGEYVEQTGASGAGLVRIDDLSAAFVDASSPEIEVGKLKVGQETLIKASAVLTRSYKGKIQHISLAARESKDWDKSRVEFPVRIQVSDKDENLKPGMSVIVDIITHKLPSVLTLRHEFIQKDGEQYFVVTDQGARKDIEVGVQNEDAFEIKKGLNEGDKVRQADFLAGLKEK